jgi:hypothetical protein
MSEAKARIIGYLMGDGCVFEVNKGGGKNYPAPFIAFYNKELSLVERFIEDCEEVYGTLAKYNSKRAEVRLYRKAIFNDLIRHGHFGTFKWSIPSEIMSKAKYKKEWLKAFCDSEATVDFKRKEIVIYSANKTGLEKVCQAFADLGIYGRIYGFYAGAYRLRINGKDNLKLFAENCNFYHHGKRGRLLNILKSNRKIPSNSSFKHNIFK